MTPAAFLHYCWICCLHSFCQGFSWVHLVLKKVFFSPFIVWWWKFCLKFILSCLPVFFVTIFLAPLYPLLSKVLPDSYWSSNCVMLSILVNCEYFSSEGRLSQFSETQESPLSTCAAATSPFKGLENASVLFKCISHDPGFYPCCVWQFNIKLSCKRYADNNYCEKQKEASQKNISQLKLLKTIFIHTGANIREFLCNTREITNSVSWNKS